jgi:cytoskeletal protein CcmA (bactofilin family)
VWVSYNYAFSADLGAGEYDRPLSQPAIYNLYIVGENEAFTRINDALAQWQKDAPQNAVIEIADSGVYVEPINVSLKPAQTLQLRAANRCRPAIRLLNWQTSMPDALSVTGEADRTKPEPSSWFTLDGILVTGRGVQVQGEVAGVVIRHSTLVPGWGLNNNCDPERPTEPSLELDNAPQCLRIEHSIIGAIQVNLDEVTEDPCRIHISDSIVDATSEERVAVGAPEKLCAYAVLEIRRSTVIGKVQAHAVELAENSIFMGSMLACRRQQGCMRFCYSPSGSRTPKRFECQPDLVENAVLALARKDHLSSDERNTLLTSERLRVEPEFDSLRYGTPTYCRLADSCAEEITRGTEDQSEMGVFHDLYQPQRAANLRARLDEFTPAGMTAGIIYAT